MHYSHLLEETCNKLEPCFIEKYTLSISSKPDIPFYWASWHWQIPATDSTFKMSSSAEWCSQTLRQACCREKPESAMCVQNLNDSRGFAIRITYRISLRSSSLWEPRHPLLKVVMNIVSIQNGGGGSQQKSEHPSLHKFRSFGPLSGGDQNVTAHAATDNESSKSPRPPTTDQK